MSRPDPMIASNAHVRRYAIANRLRTAVRDDGEVVLLVGPRKPLPARICRTGRIFYSDHHASFGLRPGLWTIFVGPTTPRQLSAIVAPWKELGLAPHVLDFEAWVDVPEDRLLAVLDAHRLTVPRRRRTLSPEQAAAAVERLIGPHRPPASAVGTLKDEVSGTGDRSESGETTSESSAPAAPSTAPESHVLGGGAR